MWRPFGELNEQSALLDDASPEATPRVLGEKVRLDYRCHPPEATSAERQVIAARQAFPALSMILGGLADRSALELSLTKATSTTV